MTFNDSIPPWLAQGASPVQSLLAGAQVGSQIANNFANLRRLRLAQDEQDALMPLKKAEYENQLASSALDLAHKQTEQQNELETKAGVVALSTAMQGVKDWAAPDAMAPIDEVVKRFPALALTKGGNFALAKAHGMHQIAVGADSRLKVAETKTDPGMKSAEYFNELMTKAEEADSNGDSEAAKELRAQAQNVKDFTMRHSAVGAPGGGVKPTAAMINADAFTKAKEELDAANLSGDADRIKTATFKFNALGAATKMPGMTDATQRLSLSSRTIPERIYSNATLAWDQVNTLLNNKGEEGAGPYAAGAALYQKTVGNFLPSEIGETAVANQSKYSQLRNSLEAMASADRSRSAALIKEIDKMMPPNGVWTSPAAAKTQLAEVRNWVRNRARQAALDKGDLPPYWAITMDDAADAVIAGEKARASGMDPKSDQFRRKYLTEEDYKKMFLPVQPPSNAPIQLPNPPR